LKYEKDKKNRINVCFVWGSNLPCRTACTCPSPACGAPSGGGWWSAPGTAGCPRPGRSACRPGCSSRSRRECSCGAQPAGRRSTSSADRFSEMARKSRENLRFCGTNKDIPQSAFLSMGFLIKDLILKTIHWYIHILLEVSK